MLTIFGGKTSWYVATLNNMKQTKGQQWGQETHSVVDSGDGRRRTLGFFKH